MAGGHKIEKCNVVVWLRIEILRFLTNILKPRTEKYRTYVERLVESSVFV